VRYRFVFLGWNSADDMTARLRAALGPRDTVVSMVCDRGDIIVLVLTDSKSPKA
jgi:hypothetical protein